MIQSIVQDFAQASLATAGQIPAQDDDDRSVAHEAQPKRDLILAHHSRLPLDNRQGRQTLQVPILAADRSADWAATRTSAERCSRGTSKYEFTLRCRATDRRDPQVLGEAGKGRRVSQSQSDHGLTFHASCDHGVVRRLMNFS